MNNKRFEGILNSRIQETVRILGNKAKEYAGDDDRLYNFKRAAELQRNTPKEALWGMFTKHLVSVIDIVEGRSIPTVELIEEKIGDSINYLILLEAILKEGMVSDKCLECGDCSNGEVQQ